MIEAKFKMSSSSRSKHSTIGLLLCATLALAAHAKSIEDLKPLGALEFDVSARAPKPQDSLLPTTTRLEPITPPASTVRDIIDKLTTVFGTSSSAASTLGPSRFDLETSTRLTNDTNPAAGVGSMVEDANNRENSPARTSKTTGKTATTTKPAEEGTFDEPEAETDGEENAADSCKGLASADKDAKGAPLTGAQRLLNLQTCMEAKVKRKLADVTRNGLELFEKLSLSGGCTSSLMNLMTSLGELKGFAFKFLDASAKVPSGMMYGLLSDFGDFDQCLSIRSDPHVDPRDEEEERAYSGKYCLLSVRLKYHVSKIYLASNSSQAVPPAGIYPDGVLWDELVRNYWTSDSRKGFQVGVCVPSRCTQDDLDQIYTLMAESYYFDGQVQGCQDSNDLRRQQTPDWLQLAIIHLFLFVVALNAVGSLVERYSPCAQAASTCEHKLTLARVIVCFSIQRNWRYFFLQAGHSRQCPMPPAQARENLPTSRDPEARARTPLLEQPELERGAPSDDYNSSFMDESESSFSSASCKPEVEVDLVGHVKEASREFANQRLRATVKILPALEQIEQPKLSGLRQVGELVAENYHKPDELLSHLSGLKLLVIVWITAGHSFLYPSANNYQYYRSIIKMNITRDSVWFAATNFTLGTDMLLYMTGLLFVYKLAFVASSVASNHSGKASERAYPNGLMVFRLISRRILRFWPTYLSVIALAIVIPLASDGPMWPEMVTARLGATCRSNWWANFLMINNLFPEAQVCLPSSWFVSVLMQCLLVGSLILLAARKYSLKFALLLLASLLLLSAVLSFLLAYLYQVSGPAIKMDETFIMELDDNIFRMYTNTLNNLGPFLVGMLGGFVLVRWRHRSTEKATTASPQHSRPIISPCDSQIERLSKWMFQLNLAFAMALTATLVLSSVFFTHYTRFWAAVYWSCHRVCWAIVTGYLVHQCATNRWRLIKDLLSLSSFLPLSRLIFIAYLVFPIFIHVHSGLVRDGLHVSIYNMLNIYITRLVMTFITALVLHLLIELPFCALSKLILNTLIQQKQVEQRRPKLAGLSTTGAKEQTRGQPTSISVDASKPSEKTTIPPSQVVNPTVNSSTCDPPAPSVGTRSQ